MRREVPARPLSRPLQFGIGIADRDRDRAEPSHRKRVRDHQGRIAPECRPFVAPTSRRRCAQPAAVPTIADETSALQCRCRCSLSEEETELQSRSMRTVGGNAPGSASLLVGEDDHDRGESPIAPLVLEEEPRPDELADPLAAALAGQLEVIGILRPVHERRGEAPSGAFPSPRPR